jgi:hypothetical protein
MAKALPINPAKRLLTINQTVSEYGGTPWMWRSLIWSRKLPEVRIGRLVFLDRAEIEAFICRQTQTA